jgi:glycosyltransferase involved in cell wall biosynthesis
MSIIDALEELGHEPVVLTNECDMQLYPTLLDEEIWCARKNLLSRSRVGKVVDAISATFLLTKRSGHLDGLFLTGMYFASAPMKIVSDTKIILYVHAPVCVDWTLDPTLRKISKKIEGKLYRSADYVLSNSKLTRNTLREHLKLDSEVLYPPVDTDFFSYSTKREANTIVSICRLHPKKRSELMIEYFKELKGNNRFMLAGFLEDRFTEYRRRLMEIAAQDNRVSLLFNPNDEEIKDLYQSATLFWYIYAKEEFGIPVAEAMSCGSPVVAFRGGGVSEIVANNLTGFLVCSKEEFLERTAFLLNNPDVCRQMGIAARKYVENAFGCDTFAKRLQKILIHVFYGHNSELGFVGRDGC